MYKHIMQKICSVLVCGLFFLAGCNTTIISQSSKDDILQDVTSETNIDEAKQEYISKNDTDAPTSSSQKSESIPPRAFLKSQK